MSNARRFEESIILVSCLQAHSVLNILSAMVEYELIVAEILDQGLDACTEAVCKTEIFVKNDGTVANHLDFNSNQYKKNLVLRPHMHWTWCGLCHANSGGDWETATVAFLEPLNEFKYIYGCSPYDTMVVGSHRLSQNSIILIPLEGVERLRERLVHFNGKVIGYDSKAMTLRNAIVNIMNQEFSYAGKLLNKNKCDIATLAVSNGQKEFLDHVCQSQGYDMSYGYFDRYYFKLSEQENDIELLQSPSTILCEKYREYSRDKYVGLHHGSKTDIEKDITFKILESLSVSPQHEVKNYHRMLVGGFGLRKIKQLLSVIVYRKCEELQQLGSHTGMPDYGHYLLKKAVIADFHSIHYDLKFDTPLQDEQLRCMIDYYYFKILDCLKTLAVSCRRKDFIAYRRMVSYAYGDVLGSEVKNALEQLEVKDALAYKSQAAQEEYGFWSAPLVMGLGAAIAMSVVGGIYFYRQSDKD